MACSRKPTCAIHLPYGMQPGQELAWYNIEPVLQDKRAASTIRSNPPAGGADAEFTDPVCVR